MTSFPSSLARGLAVVAVVTALAVTHIAFAAAAPTPAQAALNELALTKAGDVESTSSIPSGTALAENCYVDLQVVKGIRGKPVVTRTLECD